VSCRVQPGEKKNSTKKKVSDVVSKTGDKIATTETIVTSTSVTTSESTPAAETIVANTALPTSAAPPATERIVGNTMVPTSAAPPATTTESTSYQLLNKAKNMLIPIGLGALAFLGNQEENPSIEPAAEAPAKIVEKFIVRKTSRFVDGHLIAQLVSSSPL